MAPNSRKRAMDIQWELPLVTKLQRNTNANMTPSAPEHTFSATGQSRFRIHPACARTVAHKPGQEFTFTLPPEKPSTPLDGPTSVYKPVVLHQPHPDSKLCENFHWVPYPLGLMPYDSWHQLHHREDVQPPVPFRCPVCLRVRKATPHMRKVFLVAERLLWDGKLMPMHDKDLNEELNWKVNYELGIMDPFVEDPEEVPGGKHSQTNKFYPYQNEHEMTLALRFIFMTEDITEASWALWIGTHLDLQMNLEGEESTVSSSTVSDPIGMSGSRQISNSNHGAQKSSDPGHTPNLTVSHDLASKLAKGKSHRLPTPPSSLPKVTQGVHHDPDGMLRKTSSSSSSVSAPTVAPPQVPRKIQSYKTLQEFYSLLDKIERTSYVGALFLEAYAVKLRDDMCKGCWLKHNIQLDLF
ncbi:hypothetical protein CC86DRAFT_367419 [Ophiobolus disseminans]|uniref:Uncharacterized protein n=1 Tax=Ophiobolus disseminans TaxID=1469910 RepID=A0A6A7ADC3_9PLEO|nr:hypothetical protein CC86DRAFT_367419 [Ophiobolus disseminans]